MITYQHIDKYTVQMAVLLCLDEFRGFNIMILEHTSEFSDLAVTCPATERAIHEGAQVFLAFAGIRKDTPILVY